MRNVNRVMMNPGQVQYLRNRVAFERGCPRLYRAVHGKRFLLPAYRQQDYTNQDHLNEEMEVGLLATVMGFLGYEDEVQRALYVNYCGGLKCDRPALFLEKELGGPLVESALPTEMVVEDIAWPWPQFRVYLPLGLLTIERGGGLRSLTYLDICRIAAGERFGMPSEYAEEVEGYLRKFFPDVYAASGRVPATLLRMDEKEPYVSVAGQIDYSEAGRYTSGTSYASVIPWTNQKIGELLAISTGLASPYSCDDRDKAFLGAMLRLALNTLLFLSQKPFFYKPEIVRALKQEGKHHIKPALARAHFVGAERFKRASELLEAQTKKAAAAAGTTYHLPAHWRKGHWKRQPYGPKHTLRRWQWVSIYHTFGLDGLGPGGEMGKGV
jgi:hypothetical protein